MGIDCWTEYRCKVKLENSQHVVSAERHTKLIGHILDQWKTQLDFFYVAAFQCVSEKRISHIINEL